MPFRERWRFFNDTLMSTCKNHVSNSKIKDIKGCPICGCSWSIHAWTSNVTKIRLFFFFHPFIHFSMCLFTMYLQTIKVRCLLAMIIHKYLCLFLWLQFIAIRWDSTRQLQSLSTFFFKWQPIPSYMQQFNKLVHSATSSLRNITLQNIRRCSYQFIFWKSSCRVDTITVSANKTDGIMDATGTHPLFSLALRSAEWVGEGVPDEGMQEGMCKYPDLLLGLWRPANIKMIMTASSFANFVWWPRQWQGIQVWSCRRIWRIIQNEQTFGFHPRPANIRRIMIASFFVSEI